MIVQVTLSEIIGQGCYIPSRGFWDHETDPYSTGTFRNVCTYREREGGEGRGGEREGRERGERGEREGRERGERVI